VLDPDLHHPNGSFGRICVFWTAIRWVVRVVVTRLDHASASWTYPTGATITVSILLVYEIN